MAVPAIISRLIGSKNFRKAVAGGAAAVGTYFATKSKPAAKKKKAIKRSMRFNKQVATTTEKKPTGARAAWFKKQSAGQKKSNLQRKPKRTY